MNEKCPTCGQAIRDPASRVLAWMIHRLIERPGIRRGELTVACNSRDRALLRSGLADALRTGLVVDEGEKGLRIA